MESLTHEGWVIGPKWPELKVARRNSNIFIMKSSSGGVIAAIKSAKEDVEKMQNPRSFRYALFECAL